jgi:hypothetical protein
MKFMTDDDDDEERASSCGIDNQNPDKVAGEVCTTLQVRL